MSLKTRFIPICFHLFFNKKVSFFIFDSFVTKMMRRPRLNVDSTDALETTSHVMTLAEDVDSSKGCWLIERMLTHRRMLTQAEDVKWSEGSYFKKSKISIFLFIQLSKWQGSLSEIRLGYESSESESDISRSEGEQKRAKTFRIRLRTISSLTSDRRPRLLKLMRKRRSLHWIRWSYISPG